MLGEARVLGTLTGQQQFAQIALDEFGLQAAFLGSALAEAPPVGVFAEIDLIDVEALRTPQTQGDLEHVEAVVFEETTDSVAPRSPSCNS